jgi:sirohydrochlorin ferrochelatase
MEAIIYVAHGSRNKAANEKFHSLINEVMKTSEAAIQAYGFLEHAEPSIADAIEACIDQRARVMTIVPVFLLPGIHANVDIPLLLKKYPDIVFRYGQPLGVEDCMTEILCDRLAVGGFNHRPDETVLLVGHGSRVQAAAVQFETLAFDLSKRIGVKVNTAYLTTPVFYHKMVENLLDNKIYILPYLLFSGGYTAKMEKTLRAYREKIILCDPLGFDEKLVPLIQKRASEALVYE